MLKAQSVTGKIEINTLGVTLPHEHILCDARSVFFSEPLNSSEKHLAFEPVTLKNLAWIRSHALNNLDCLKMPEIPVLKAELEEYKKAGGRTIVDLSTRPLGGNNPLGLKELAVAAGVNIIMGAGFYLTSIPEIASATETQIAENLVCHLTKGVDGSGICAGIIGEIGVTKNLSEPERRLLRACAFAQSQTGAPIAIHPPGIDFSLIKQILDLIKGNGGKLEKTVICHVDIMGLNDFDSIRSIADAGCFVEFDTFGHLFPPFVVPNGLMDFPGDGQRIKVIKRLIEDGYINHILLSQDTFLKVLLTTYGGFGYSHILRNVVPAMLASGLTQAQIETLLQHNPARLLAFLE